MHRAAVLKLQTALVDESHGMLDVKLSSEPNAIILKCVAPLGLKAEIVLPKDKTDGVFYVRGPNYRTEIDGEAAARACRGVELTKDLVLASIFSAFLTTESQRAAALSDYQERKIRSQELFIEDNGKLYTLGKRVATTDLKLGRYVTIDEETKQHQALRFHMLDITSIQDAKKAEYKSITAYMSRYRISTMSEIWNELEISGRDVGLDESFELQHGRMTANLYLNGVIQEFYEFEEHKHAA